MGYKGAAVFCEVTYELKTSSLYLRWLLLV